MVYRSELEEVCVYVSLREVGYSASLPEIGFAYLFEFKALGTLNCIGKFWTIFGKGRFENDYTCSYVQITKRLLNESCDGRFG